MDRVIASLLVFAFPDSRLSISNNVMMNYLVQELSIYLSLSVLLEHPDSFAETNVGNICTGHTLP